MRSLQYALIQTRPLQCIPNDNSSLFLISLPLSEVSLGSILENQLPFCTASPIGALKLIEVMPTRCIQVCTNPKPVDAAMTTQLPHTDGSLFLTHQRNEGDTETSRRRRVDIQQCLATPNGYCRPASDRDVTTYSVFWQVVEMSSRRSLWERTRHLPLWKEFVYHRARSIQPNEFWCTRPRVTERKGKFSRKRNFSGIKYICNFYNFLRQID